MTFPRGRASAMLDAWGTGFSETKVGMTIKGFQEINKIKTLNNSYTYI